MNARFESALFAVSGSFHALLMNICVRLIQHHEVGYPAKASMAQPVMPFAQPAGVMIGQRVDGGLATHQITLHQSLL
jgi:hypothetical protein